MGLWPKVQKICRKVAQYRHISNKNVNEVEIKGFSRIRNIGILAHIDAGKTTTTERMLYFAGTIGSMGEVHHGNTVTDFMNEEKLRGITIAAVTVTFPWSGYSFNLVDTPGHIDFTMEVEQSLGVIDGAIVVLDGSAGVEAQTTTVWQQADRYSIPRLVYCNKMDRKDASLQLCLDSLKSKLNVQPLPVHLPLYDENKCFVGLVNLITLEKISWSDKDQGRSYFKENLKEIKNKQLWEEAVNARSILVDTLSNFDDHLAEQIIQTESLDNLSGESLVSSLRRVTLSRCGVPVLCGSSYKNLGVQLLMDAVIDFLPSPEERSDLVSNYFGNNLCARAFKVIHNEQRKMLTFLRIYSGKISKGQRIYNITQQKTEQTAKLMIPYADDHEETSEIKAGNIAVLSGLKYTRSGDIITSSSTVAATQTTKLLTEQSNIPDNSILKEMFSSTPNIPVPVFLCSIEPSSQAYQNDLEEALIELQREDPSLRVTNSQETGQTILSGMGELHLEIIKNRLVSDYKLDVELGPLQIAYKEALLNKVEDTFEMSHKIGSTKHYVKVTLSAWTESSNEKTGDMLLFDRSPESSANLAVINPKQLQAVKHGIDSALTRGPKLNCPVIDARIMLHWLEVGRGTSNTIISAAVSQCLHKLFTTSGTSILEPVMKLEVATSTKHLSVVLADLSRRRAATQNISNRLDTRTLFAVTPLSELLGYSRDLRTITSGEASFSMEFHGYQALSANEESIVIQKTLGFLPS